MTLSVAVYWSGGNSRATNSRPQQELRRRETGFLPSCARVGRHSNGQAAFGGLLTLCRNARL